MHSGKMFFAFNEGGFGPESGDDVFGEGFGVTGTGEKESELEEKPKENLEEEDEDESPDTGDSYDDGDWESF